MANGGNIGGNKCMEACNKRMGLKGGEKCPGATRHGRLETCDVFKNGLDGRGSDGQAGRMIEGKWH